MNFTRLSKVISAVLVTGYVVQLLVPSSRQYLALVPGRFIPCVWNIFTAGLLEVSIVKAVVSVAGTLLLARIIEPVWGSKEFLVFICVVNAGAGMATLALLYVLYALNHSSEHSGDLLYKEVAGFQGVCAGCLVAVKQIMPDNEVLILGFIRFRAKLLPAIFLTLAVPVTIALHHTLDTVPFLIMGTYIAWIYLRFFQRKSETHLRGDPSNEFRFATFLPEALQPPVDQFLSLFDRCLPSRTGSDGQDALLQPHSAPLPGSDAADASRRRERGARALEDRLKKASAAAAVQPAAADVEAGTQKAEGT
ncbi:hypothetical protein WJX73_010621 [Symbiochloris irregularis]|uniref:Transmembrane protein 115 n=1 Tax=Symbiochloris irregularis TaxID=706552 RepID=A0AAW1NW69_9CHLO